MNKLFLIIFSLILIPLLVEVGLYLYFNHQINLLTSNVVNHSQSLPEIVTIDQIQTLPEPVQKYLAYSNVIGKPIPKIVHLQMRGRIRSDEASNWMTLEATETYTTNPPAFVWKASLPSMKLPITLGRDAYVDGQGSMLIKMLSIFPLADATGTEMDQGGLMRYLNEIMWFPQAFLGENISWQPIDDTSAQVTISDHGQTATATVYFDPTGQIKDFIAPRYRSVGDTYLLENWSTPIVEYGEFNGIKVPTKGSAVWQLDTGDLTYIELEIFDVIYEY